MSHTRTGSTTQSYTKADIQRVILNLKADLVMIAESTGGWTVEEARNYAHDIEVLANEGYLEYVDVTLLSEGQEIKAVRYNVDTNAGALTTKRPGGVLWPKVDKPLLRIIVSYTSDYTENARELTKEKLKIKWTRSTDDISHSNLKSSTGRNYVSNNYSMQRKDWAT